MKFPYLVGYGLHLCLGSQRLASLAVGEVRSNKQEKYRQKGLCFSPEKGYKGVAKILLRQDNVNRHMPDSPEQTHLCFAAMKEHEEATKMLLRRDDANLDNLGQYEKTPLC